MNAWQVEGISYLGISVKTNSGFEDQCTANASSEASDLVVMVPDTDTVLDLQHSHVNSDESAAAVIEVSVRCRLLVLRKPSHLIVLYEVVIA